MRGRHAVVLAMAAFVWSLAATAVSAQETDGPALTRISKAGAALVRQVARSVVQVVATVYQPNPSDSRATLTKARSIGSGVVVDAAGYVMTNAHVIAGAASVDLVLDGYDERGAPRVVSASVEAIAPDVDLALLRVPLHDLPALKFGESADLEPGELVFALGNPDGLGNSVSMGIVSAVARHATPETAMTYIQTDAAVNPGQSGGPLVNANGELVGINTFIRSASGGSEGLAFAIPSAVVAEAFPSMRDCGFFQRPVTGMSVQALTPGFRQGLGLRASSGLLVSHVSAGGPADQGGLRVGDVITAIDGQPVPPGSGLEAIFARMLKLRQGQTVALRVDRLGHTHSVVVRAAGDPRTCPTRPELVDPGALVDELGVFGASVAAVEARAGRRAGTGVLVTALVSTRTAVPSLAAGDIVRAVNGVAVASVGELRAALAAVESGRVIVLQVERGGRLTFVEHERD